MQHVINRLREEAKENTDIMNNMDQSLKQRMERIS